MRDENIKRSFTREINLRQRVVRDRTKYTRKTKHKKDTNELIDYDKSLKNGWKIPRDCILLINGDYNELIEEFLEVEDISYEVLIDLYEKIWILGKFVSYLRRNDD